MNMRAGLNNNAYGSFCPPFVGFYTCARTHSPPPPPTFPQMALSQGPSTPHGRRRRCGPSGRASSRHRTTQSSSHTLREASRTCSL